MSEKGRPTAKRILDGILRAMHDAGEPLDDGLVLIPTDYDVYLHADAYQELRPLMPRIREQAQKRLDGELVRLNSRRDGPLPGFLRRMIQAVMRWLYADVYVRPPVGRHATYERAGRRWRVNFSVTPEAAAGVEYLLVEVDFGIQAQTAYKGHPTLNIRRHTVLLPNGRFETVLSARRPTAPVRAGAAADEPAGPPVAARARLCFEDDGGRQVYYMTKDQIIIGRKDDPAHYLDVALEARPDVSREHARIRHDPQTGRFAIKDLSRYGTTVDGVRIGSSLNEQDEDVNAWHSLPSKAEIGLAGIVFIHFEAL